MNPGIAYGMATSGGSGGCTTTGAASRKFYSNPAIRERLVQLCPLAYRPVYREILANSELRLLSQPNFLSIASILYTLQLTLSRCSPAEAHLL